MHFGIGHRHFDIADGIELAQLLFRLQILLGHRQFGGGNFGAGFGFIAVETGEYGGLGDLFTEAGFQFAQSAGHLAGQGGFQFGGK
ncbi:hypothetical protein D3C84_955810 [compost metagenome]